MHAATLFGLVDTGELYASSDGGVTWAVQSTLPVSDAIGINAGETTSELVLVTSSGLVYRSVDAGLNWTAMGAVTASDVCAMLIRPSGDLFLLTESGILWKSSNEGATFTSVAALTASNHVSLTFDNWGNFYALTKTGEVARSSDEGVSWDVVGTITTSGAVAIRSANSYLFVLTETGDMARSDDWGNTWTMVGTISQVHMTALLRQGKNLIVASREGLIAKTLNGTSWKWLGSINQVNVMALGDDTPTVTGVGPIHPPELRSLELLAVWPNPQGSFSGSTNISFFLPESDAVGIEVYDVRGYKVAARPAESFAGGTAHTISWTIGKLPTGIYFARLIASTGESVSYKIAVVR